MEKIQLHYLPVEDRLLLLVKMSEQQAVTLWLTRRVTKQLLGQLALLVQKDNAVMSQDSDTRKTHVQEFQRQQAAQSSQFSQEQVDVKQLIEQYQPNLVAEVKLDGKIIRMPMSNGQVLNLELSTQLAYVVTNLINSAVARTDWQLSALTSQSKLDFSHQKYPTMTLN